VKGLRRWILLLGFWLGALAEVQGQSVPGGLLDLTEIQPPPAAGLRDKAGIFQRNGAALARITGQIQQLREEHDFQIYVVVESVLVNGNPQKLAAELQNEWLPSGKGMVLVYETDSRTPAFGQSTDQKFGAEAETGQVPSYETMAILVALGDGMDRTEPPDVFLEKLITRLTEGYGDYFKRKEAPVPKGRSMRLVLIIVGGAAGLALIGLGAAWLLNRTDRGNRLRKYFFPETDAVERLGAPYGGGAISSRRFGKPPEG